ncbi:IS5/IS1182 family transposase, partial [Shigella flexneri]
RIKQLFGGSLTLRACDGQVADALAVARALNKMTKAAVLLLSLLDFGY